MNNMDNIIKAHNTQILNSDATKQIESTCNCRNKETCPLPQKCTIENVVYQAKVTSTNSTKFYIGLTSTTFKSRYDQHKSSFNSAKDKHNTELSKHIWKLKDNNTPYQITWKILQQAQPYYPKTKRCNLCLSEKYHIITADKSTTLNSRSELISSCRHRRKFLLSQYKKRKKSHQ